MKRSDFIKALCVLPAIPLLKIPETKASYLPLKPIEQSSLTFRSGAFTIKDLKPIWRVGELESFTIRPPGDDFILAYKITDDETGYVKSIVQAGKPGELKSFEHAFHDPMRTYSITICAAKGAARCYREFPRAITVLPPPFKSEDNYNVWEFQPGKGWTSVNEVNKNNIDRSNYKVWCSGVYHGPNYRP